MSNAALPLLLALTEGYEPASVTVELEVRWQTLTVVAQTPVTPVPVPTDLVLRKINASVTCVTRRVDIFEADGVTAYALDVPIVTGQVTVSQSSAERRTMSLTLHACGREDELEFTAGKLWYDKVIKIYRGVDGYEAPLGTFLLDRADRGHADESIVMTGRDHTKILTGSRLAYPTYFPANEPIENIISALASNGGISRQSLPLTGANTSQEYTFDSGTVRWDACREIAETHGYELFFDTDGVLVMDEFADVNNDPIAYVFETGIASNLAAYQKQLTDARIRNHVVVKGQNANKDPIFAEARNTDVGSPTNVSILGERTEIYESAFVATVPQAQALADRLLTIAGLDSYEVPLEAIVTPWLDVNTITTFVDPNPAAGDPTRFLMTDLTVPLGLETMKATLRRVVTVA